MFDRVERALIIEALTTVDANVLQNNLAEYQHIADLTVGMIETRCGALAVKVQALPAPVSIHDKIGLAKLFGEQVQAALSPTQFRAMVDANKADDPLSPVCHSHDYCDANVLMGAAWLDMFGSEFPFADDAADSDMELWNDAWAIAKAADFFA